MWRADGDLPGPVMAPVGYSNTWLTIAFALLGVAVLAAVVFMAVRTWQGLNQAQSRAPAPVALPRPRVSPNQALVQINQVEQAHLAGQLTNRAAHHRLSQIVRACATDHLGLPANQMTLQALEALEQPQLDQVAALVRFLYPAQFGLEAPTLVAQAAATARTVVLAWV